MQVIPSNLVVFLALVEYQGANEFRRGPFKVEDTNEMIECFEAATKKFGILGEKETSNYKVLLLDNQQNSVFSKYVKEEVFTVLRQRVFKPVHINLWD